MSTLEKTINLLENMPDNKLDAVYAFVRFISSDSYKISVESTDIKKKKVRTMLGIAHEYANQTLIGQEEGAFERAMVEKYAADLNANTDSR